MKKALWIVLGILAAVVVVAAILFLQIRMSF